MIEVNLKPYCENCSDMEVENERTNYYDNAGCFAISKQIISCKYSKRCNNLYQYLKNYIENQKTIE